MGFSFSKLGKYVGRGAAALATGGGSEVYRAATGKADPYTAYQERLGQAAGNKVASATGQGADMPPNPYASETPEERQARAYRETDMAKARYYRDNLLGQTAAVTAAPQVGAPKPIQSARVGNAPTIAAPQQVYAERVNSTFDPSGQAQAQQLQQAYLERVGAAERGEGPSAGEIALRRGGAQSVAGAYALAGGHKGYGGAALRAAQRQEGATMQQTNAQAAEMRANEIARARAEYGQAVTNIRGQDIGLAQTAADLSLRAGMANQQTGLQGQIANQGAGIDVAKANQAAALQTQLTQAGFDQQTIMHMSDQELQTKLANAGMQLTQQQINDLRANNLRQAQLAANGQVIGASQNEAERQDRLKQLRAQYAMAVQANDQKQQEAILGTMAQLGMGYATGGASMAAPGGGLTSQGTIDPFA